MPNYLVELDDGRKFRVEAETPPTTEEILAYLQAPAAAPAADQPGRLGSFASSVGRGALSVVPGTVGGVGYALGSDTLTGAADTIEGGINRMLPVNPEYQDEFLMKAGGAIGQAGGMLATGGLLGAAGKGLALSRGLAQGAAAAKGADLAKNVLLGTGIAQGIRGGGQEAEKYGLQGGSAYARALLGGAIEGLSERYLFGMGTELAPVKKLLGDAAEKGVGGIVKAAGTEAGEEAAAQIGGNVATSILAPYGVQTPGAFEGAGEAALLGGIAGGTIGGINALIQPSPTIEGETMVPPAGTEPPATAAQEPEDDFGLAAFQQEIEQIVQNPDPIVPLQQTINQAAVTSVKAKADLLPATAAVIEAGGLAPAPTPVAAQPAVVAQATREEQLAQLRNKIRLGLSAKERADMEQQLAQAEDEGVLSDVFAEERRKAVQREDFLRRQRDLEDERQRLADQGILKDVFAEERQKAISREQPTPTIEETTPPEQPIPAVEEAPAPTQRAIAEEDKAELAELEDLMSRRGQAQNKVKGVKFSKKDEARFQELGAKLRRYFFETVDPVNDPVVGEDIYDQPIRQSAQGTYYTVEKGRIRTGPWFKLDPEYVRQQDELLRQEKAVKEAPAPEITSEEFPNVENVIDEPGAAEVVSGMEELNETYQQFRDRKLRELESEDTFQDLEASEKADILDDYADLGTWGESLVKRAETEQLSEEVLDDYVDRFGLDTYAIRFRGKAEQRQYKPKAARQQLGKESLDVRTRGQKAADTRKAKQAQPPKTQPAAEKQAAETQGKKGRALPTFSPPPKEPFKPSAERFTQFYVDAGIPEATAAKNGAKLMQVVETGEWSDLLHPDNKKSRAIWETWTGKKLPKGLAASKAAVAEFVAEYRAENFTTPASELSDTELNAEILRLAEQGMKPSASQTLKDRALELSKEFQLRQETGKAKAEDSSIKTRRAAIARKALAFTGGKGTVGNLAGDSFAQMRADLLSEITGTKVPKAKAGINALMKAFYQEFGIASDTEAGMQKKLSQALQEAVAPTAPAPQAEQPAPQRDTSKPEIPAELKEKGVLSFVEKSKDAETFDKWLTDQGVSDAQINPEKGDGGAGYLYLDRGTEKVGQFSWSPKSKTGVDSRLVFKLPDGRNVVWLIETQSIYEVDPTKIDPNPYFKEETAFEKPSEQMSPEEAWAEEQSVMGKAASKADTRMVHEMDVNTALGKKKPVSKAAVDAYGITLPEGYVAEGELYVYRPGGEVKADKTELAQVGDEVTWVAAGKEAQGTVYAIRGDSADIDYFGPKTVPLSDLSIVRKSGRRIAQEKRDAESAKSESPQKTQEQEQLKPKRKFTKDEVASLEQGKTPEGWTFDKDRSSTEGVFITDKKGQTWKVEVQFSPTKILTLVKGDETYSFSAQPTAPVEFGSTNATISTPEGYQAARKRVAKKIGGQTNVGGMLDPVLLKDIIAIGAFYIEGGARSFASFSAKMIEDLGEGVRKYIQPAYDELRKRTDIDTTGMDPVEAVETAPVAEAPPAPAPAKVEAEAPKAPKAAPAQAAPKPAPAAAAEPGVVPIANDPVDVQRAALGLPPIMRMTKEAYTFQQMWSDAEAAMAANPERGKTLVNTLNDKPRNISALEDAILLRERVNRVNALDLAMIEFNEAPKGNNEDQRKALDNAITSLTELDNALAVAGTEQGRSLNARKMLARQDYTLAKMISTLRAANDGNLSEADIATVTRLQKQLEETQKKLAEVESGQADLLADRLAEAEKVAFEAGRQEVLKDIEDRAKADAAKVAEMQKRKAEYLAAKKEAAKTPNKWEEIRAAARARNAELRSNLYSDVVLVKAASMAVNDVIIGATYIAEGVTKFADWVSKMRSEDINLTDDEMQQLFKESKAFDAGEELPASEAPLKTRKTKAPAIDKVKAIAADEEQLDSRTVYNLVVEKMKKRAEESKAAKLLEMSPADLTSVISEVTEDVREFFPDITEREIRDLFSGYGKILMPSQDELSKQMRQLSALGKLQSAIEDAEAKRAPLKSGPQRDKATQAIRLQQKKLARELRMMGRDYEAGEDQLRSPLDAIKARLNNQIDDLAFEINNRKKIQRRPTVEYDAETKKLVELRDELKRISDFVNAPAGPTFAELVNEEMKKLDARIAELQKTLAEGKFAPKEDTRIYTEELAKKRAQRDELNAQVAKLRKIEADKSKTQEDIDKAAVESVKESIKELQRKIDEKDFTRPERRTPTETAEYLALVAQKEALQDQIKAERLKLFGRQGMSDEQRIKMATAALDKSIERMQKMLTSGNYDVPKRTSKTPETPELAQKREIKNTLRKQLLELRKLKREAAIDPIAKQLKTDKKRIQTRMKKLKERMDKGDFSKPVKRQKATDQELLDLQVKEEELKEQWAKMVFERYLASRGPGKKILDAGQQIINTARAVLTSFDVSAVLRQGGFIVLGNPVRGFRNLGPMFQAFGSDKFAKEEKFRLQNRENFKNGAYQQSKLFLADVNKVDQLSKQEEAFMSRWIDKLPKGARGLYLGSAIQGSQRAYTVFLNRLRMDTFDAMVANLKKGSEPTPQEMSAVANFINIATGRGDLGKFNQAGTALNTVFFAPRLVASRFQILAGYPYFTASGRTKALVLREYAKFFTGALLVYALGMLAQDDEDEPIETDPRSSDFLKIRFGDTRVDPLSGLIQATVLVSRLVSGEKKQASGKIVPIRGEKVPYGADDSFDVMGNFARTKFSPIVGSLVNVITGKNVVGETTDVVEETKRMLIPMSFTEMKETFESQGIPEATALTTLQLFGMGVQTYTPGKK